MRRSRLVLASLSLAVLGAVSVAGVAPADVSGVLGLGRGSGIQVTPDEQRTLISKEVDGARWAITRNDDDGSVTGNVYFPDGGDPLFLYCEETDATDDEVTLSCSGADGCITAPCGGFSSIGEVVLPLAFFALPTAAEMAAGTIAGVAALAPRAAPAGLDGRGSGIQLTPDEKRILISKQVEGARWAITRNVDDGTVTGNVYFPDGGDPLFLFCEETDATADEVTLRCSGADGCVAAPCGGFSFLSEVTLPSAFFALPTPVPLPEGPLGRRRFSIDPTTSGIRAYSSFGPTDALGFEGFLDLEGTEVDPATGIARIDVVGASERITLDGVTSGGPIVICIEPLPDQFPVIGAGIVDCNGGTAVGYDLTYDHNVGVVGQDGFTAQQCTAAGGVVEDEPHPGVCNGGPVVGTSTVDTGPGGLIIAELPQLGNPGFLVRITTETSLPCGDEGPPTFEGALPLTTGRIAVSVTDAGDTPGARLSAETVGSNFSCLEFEEENGPGTLTLGTVTYDLVPASFPGLTLDVITAFSLDD
jgi:hypothetical protein